MTRNQINKFALGYPYPTDWVEIVLKYFNFDIIKAQEILLDYDKTYEIVKAQWTDEHINELLGDFYLIPKSVVDETQPESITKKLDLNDTANIDVQIALEEEAVCEAKEAGHNNDVKYHSDILMSLWKLKRIQQEFLC